MMLISDRVYKKGFSHEEAVEIIKKGKGTHFDPELTEAFLTLNKEFQLIAKRFQEA